MMPIINIKNFIVSSNDPNSLFWTTITGIFTGGLFVVGWFQLASISKTSKADFIHKFKRDFFTPETRNLFSLIDNDKIRFISANANSHFEYKKSTRITKRIETYEMDDLMLGHFEDLGTFEKNGIIDIQMVYDFFDYYVESCWDNEEIQKYINYSGGNDIYENFRYIYEKTKSYGKAKKSGRNLLMWKMIWTLKTI